MATAQGDFANGNAAGQAKTELMQAGVAETRIRVWNILPFDDEPTRSGGGATTTGALYGGVLGGGGGLVAGAAIGSVLDGGYEEEKHLPEPSGVRIVVDVTGDAPQIEELLRSSGAANVHTAP